jgi:hypothetical protein
MLPAIDYSNVINITYIKQVRNIYFDTRKIAFFEPAARI